MIDHVLFDWAPVVIALVVGAFFADYTLTHLGARAAERVRDRWTVEGSYEMNPTWEGQIDSRRWFGWRVLVAPAAVAATLGAVRFLAGLDGEAFDPELLIFDPAYFAFAAGVMLLIQAPVLMLHAANLQTFALLADPAAAEGGITFRRWVAYRQGTRYLAGFAVLWLVLWLPSQQAFFLGGAVSCLTIAWWFGRLGDKATGTRSPSSVEPGGTASPA
jgi:hypothetical protein